MKAYFGWTLLSKEALKRAETQLREDLDGVRDEVGFLALHQAYADRFFPGTSVLHTRLRYVLFVPWLYQRLMESRERRRIDDVLEREELGLVGRLKVSEEEGIIGGRSFPKPTTQPPSMVYWGALGAWRILRPSPSGVLPSRSAVHRALVRGTSGYHLHDDDHHPLEESESIFGNLPSPSLDWSDPRKPLDFVLEPSEARFLRGCLVAVQRPTTDGSKSLLACLVGVPLTDSTELWSAKVTSAAEHEDRLPLRRSHQAAALAAIGRAAYGALVESIREKVDGIPTPNVHRRNLPEVVAEHRDEGLELDIEAVSLDAPGRINEGILTILRETQAWLHESKRDVEKLHRAYESAECARKGRRARLAMTITGREKRAEWVADEHPLARPLHYRWDNVRRLLLDLQAAS